MDWQADPIKLRAVQEDIYRGKVLRARQMTPTERLDEALELMDQVFQWMHSGAMNQGGLTDPEDGWRELERRLNRLRRLHKHYNIPGGSSLMDVYQLAVCVVAALEAENVPYMVTGAISVSVFGIPRGTKDVDVVVALETMEPLNRLELRLKEIVVFDPQVSFETITGSLRHILTTKSRPPITVELFELGADAFVQCRFSRKRQEFSAQLQRSIWLPTPEDVVVQKLRWGRSKDLDDARDVLAVQTLAALDMTYIEKWCAQHGSLEKLRQVIESIPEDLR